MKSLNNTGFYNKALRYICSYILSLTVIGIGLSLIYFFVKDTKDVSFIQQHFIHDINSFLPEQAEKLGYLFSLVSFPLLFLLFYYATASIDFGSLKKERLTVVFYVCLGYIIFLSVFILLKNGYYIKKLPANTFFISVVFLPLLLIVNKLRFSKNKFFSVSQFLGYGLCLIVSMLIVSLYYQKNYFSNDFYTIHHVHAYLYPVIKTWGGQTPYVDFENLYGGYVYFLLFAIRIIECIFHKTFTLKIFSLLMCCLILVNIACIFYILRKFLQNGFMFVLSFLCVAFFLAVYPSFMSGGHIYLQYFPHRTTFPLLFLSLCVYKHERKRNAFCELFTIALIAAALVWNMDTGIVVAFCAFLYECYENTIERADIKQRLVGYGLAAAKLFGSCGIAIGTFFIVTYLRTSSLLDIRELVWSQGVFYKNGFYMLPMEFLHPWILFAFLNFLLLGVSLTQLFTPSANRKTTILFPFAIMSLGVFSYYQGRSHAQVFGSMFWILMLNFVIFTCWISKKLHDKIRCFTIYKSVSQFVLLIPACALFLALANRSCLPLLKSKHQEITPHLTTPMQILHDNGLSFSDTMLVTMLSPEIYLQQKERNLPLHSDAIDVFSYSQIESIAQYILESSKNFLLDDTYYSLLSRNPKFLSTIETGYDLIDCSQYGGGYKVYMRPASDTLFNKETVIDEKN